MIASTNGWGIEGDKGAHFTLYASSYILTDLIINEWFELDLQVYGVNIAPYLPAIVIFPIAATSEKWGYGVYNPKDTTANYYGLGFGISIRLLNKL